MRAPVSPPLVLLALGDDPVAHALHATLLDHTPRLTVRVCSGPLARSEIVDACATEPVSLLVLSHRIDDTAGASLLRELGAFGSIPQAIALFDDPADVRRSLVSQAGALDHVLPPAGQLHPLIALIDRVITKDALEARLDAASRQFRLLVDNSNDGIYIIREGHFVYTNRRFQQMVGFTSDDLLADDFDIAASITAPESRPFLAERARRVAAGQPVEPRYEFIARRKSGEHFDAQVSISYIELEGPSLVRVGGALGIMQDITERKRFESQLVRKNRELALLNELSTSINQAVALDETLARGCRQIGAILGAEATGITLLAADETSLELRFSEGLDDEVARALTAVKLDSNSLLAHAVRSSEVMLVDDVGADPRIAIDAVRASRFGGCLVVPLKTRATSPARAPLPALAPVRIRVRRDSEEEVASEHVLGAAFVFLSRNRRPTADDRDLMISIGTLLGNAVEKAKLLEAERLNVQKLVALDEIAVALASALDMNEVAMTVAKNVHRLFGPMRVLIARVDEPSKSFVPLHVLDEGEPVGAEPVPFAETIMGLAIRERTPVQRVRPAGDGRSIDPFTNRPVSLLPYEEELFAQGIGAGVAVPVIQDGNKAVGALWLGYEEAEPLSAQDLGVLMSIGLHVAIALKNSALFAARNEALESLKAAQDKLVESEKVNAIGLIAHGVAHDFNNVLGSILGRAQLLKSQLRDPALVKHADIIEKAANDGAETVRRIQEIGRQDKIDDFVAVDLDEMVSDVVDLTQPKRGPTVHVQVTPCPPDRKRPIVAGNPHQLREVLVNLVHNAVDAMPTGGVLTLSTDVSASHAGDGGETCEVRVRDTGTGMPQEIIGRIFDPYFTTKGERGTGLGLSVSHSIVRRHGGDVDVVSRQDGIEHGTTFILTFPRYEPAPKAASIVGAKSEAKGAGNGHARVLVVDDEENIREILAEILMNGGHEVVTAADGAEALDRLREDSSRFDLVFTDLGLPGMTGYEVASEIKKIRPTLPVGLVTGWGATLDPEKARANGVDLVISKPFRFEQVLSLVDEALAAKKLRA
jgi:PAS domain S-box-containing protein